MKNNIQDWSHYLQLIVALEKHAQHYLNLKNYQKAYEILLEIEHNCRMSRVWILERKNNE